MPPSKRSVQRLVLSGVTLLAAVLLPIGPLASLALAESTREMQWYLDAMKAEEMWKVSQGEGVTVAVIDGGTDASLPELRGRVLKGKNVSEDPGDAHTDKVGHGTGMAALIAGTGARGGIQGLAPKAKILPIRDGATYWGSNDLKNIAKGIRYALKEDADIINISSGTVVPDEMSEGVQDAIDEANRRGVLIFSSAGNLGDKGNNRGYPAGLPGVVAVGATDETGKVTEFSSYGPHLALAAPGSEMAVRCEQNKGTCKGEGGTSAASALASASAALIWSKHPNWTGNQVLRVMLETAGLSADGKEPSKYLGYGPVRPRSVLLDGEGDPGDPDKSPLFSKYYAKKDASKSPSPETEDEGKDDHASDTDTEQDQGATDAATTDSTTGTNTLLIAGCAIAAVLVLGLGATVFIRRRNARPHA